MTTSTEGGIRRRRARRGSGELLRDEIIGAAKDLLAARGEVGAVSIRAVADAVGVSPPSIYLHFADKDALVDAVVADAFTVLDARMLAAAEGCEHDPLERLRAYGLAYVRFALDFPEHYRLATSGVITKSLGAVDQVLANAAFAHLNEAVAACIAADVLVGPDVLPVTLDLWAAAHGIASLMIAKPFLPWGDPEQTADRMLCACVLGHAVGVADGHAMSADQVRDLARTLRPPGVEGRTIHP